MKKISIVTFLVWCAFIGSAQVMTGKVAYLKTQQPAAIVELPYSTGVIEGAIKDQLTRKGLRAEQSRGFLVFRNMQLIPSDTVSSDLYFRIDRKNRRDDNLAVVYLVAARKNEDLNTRAAESDYGTAQATALLSELIPGIDAAGLEAQIKDQQSSSDKAERKYKDLVSDGQSLEKKKKDIETKISDNQRDQENQKLEMEKQKQAVSDLMSKRKG